MCHIRRNEARDSMPAFPHPGPLEVIGFPLFPQTVKNEAFCLQPPPLFLSRLILVGETPLQTPP